MKIDRFFDLDLGMLKSIPLLVLALFLSLNGCKNQDKKNQTSIDLLNVDIGLKENERVLKNSTYNIFMEEEYDYYYFDPSYENINSTRQALSRAVNEGKFYFLNSPQLEDLQNSHYFQFVPYKNEHNERIILINAICNTSDILQPKTYIDNVSGKKDTLNWSDYFIGMRDGGPCYWNIKVNVDMCEYFELSVNGY